MQIYNLSGTARDDYNVRKTLNSIKRPDLEVDVVHPTREPAHLAEQLRQPTQLPLQRKGYMRKLFTNTVRLGVKR